NVPGCQKTSGAIEYPREGISHGVQCERRCGPVGLPYPLACSRWTDVQLATGLKGILMSGNDKRRSERVIPFVSDEEVIFIHQEVQKNVLAKMMDLSEVGTLVYLLEDTDISSPAELSLYHQGKVFKVPASVIRKNGRLNDF